MSDIVIVPNSSCSKSQKSSRNVSSHLSIKIASEPEEILQAQRLRYEVFLKEIKGDAAASAEGIEKDDFDPFCDHLIVTDQETHKIIGTHRLLLDKVAKANIGFFAATKFNLTPFDQLSGGILEVSRACIDKEYRHGPALNILWQKISEYAMTHGVRYTFGSLSFPASDVGAINRTIAMFKALNFFNDIGIRPKSPENAFPIDATTQIAEPEKLFDALPAIFKRCVLGGGRVCGYPVQGDFFGAIFPVLLDIKQVDNTYRERFYGDYLLEEKSFQ